MQTTKKKPSLIFILVGAVLAGYLGYLINGAWTEGIAFNEFMDRFNEVCAVPFANYYNSNTVKAVAIALGIYAMAIVMYYTSQRNYMPGKEFGTARFENPKQVNKILADKDENFNRILSQNVKMSLDFRRLKLNGNILICGGSGAGKTFYEVKPNLMQMPHNCSFICTDPKGEILAEGFTEYYRAANVTVFAKFCRDDVELGRFLQGYYNDSKKFYFDKATSSPECITKMDEIGMTDRGWIDDFILHYEKCDRTFERGQTFHNFNDHDYMVLEALSPRNLVVMDMKSGSLTIALGATEYKRYPKDEEPTKDNTTIGVSWEHGIYLGSTLSQTNFKAYKREYGTPEKIKDVYDYRAKLKQKFYFYQDLSKDDDIPKNMQNDFLHQMYKEFGTIEEEYFYDRLEDGKYDEGFKERQVKEKKSR